MSRNFPFNSYLRVQGLLGCLLLGIATCLVYPISTEASAQSRPIRVVLRAAEANTRLIVVNRGLSCLIDRQLGLVPGKSVRRGSRITFNEISGRSGKASANEKQRYRRAVSVCRAAQPPSAIVVPVVTNTPTSAPTSRPQTPPRAPTAAPSPAPTALPSAAPTSAPSAPPTSVPPGSTPTAQPTEPPNSAPGSDLVIPGVDLSDQLIVEEFSDEPGSGGSTVNESLMTNTQWLSTGQIAPSINFGAIRSYQIGLRALYSFDTISNGQTPDGIVAGRQATVTGGSFLATGRFGGAYCGGSGSRINTASPIGNTEPDTGFSAGAWINTEQFSGTVFDVTFDEFRMYFGRDQAGNATLNCRVRDRVVGLSNQPVIGVIPAGLANQWFFTACTYNPTDGRLRVWANGVQLAERQITFSNFASPNELKIASGNLNTPDSANYPLQGCMDQFAYWGRALSASEVAALSSDTSAITPLEPARFLSKRVTASTRFSDLRLNLTESTPGTSIVEVSTDGMGNWCRLNPGQAISELSSELRTNCRLPGSGFYYRVTFQGNSQIERLSFTAQRRIPAKTLAPTKLGMNLDMLSYYAGNFMYLNVLKNASAFEGTGITLRADGYPVQVVRGTSASSFAVQAHPSGLYVAECRGRGEIVLGETYSLENTGTNPDNPTLVCTGGSQPNRRIVRVVQGQRVVVRIIESNAADPVRALALVPQGFEYRYQTEVFHPTWLAGLAQSKALRIMRNSTQYDGAFRWEERATRDHYSYTGPYDFPVEDLALLSSRLDAPLWISMVHTSDTGSGEAYWRPYARRLAQLLPGHLPVYIEYSNELWNTIFVQTGWANSNFSALGFQSVHQLIASRALLMGSIFRQELGEDRVVLVAGGFSAGSGYNLNLLAAAETAPLEQRQRICPVALHPTTNLCPVRFDALAIAPYFGNDVPNSVADSQLEASLSVDGILDRAEGSFRRGFESAVTSAQQIAEQFSVELVAYEGGQHLVGYWGRENNLLLTQKLMAANRHPRMRELYLEMFSRWTELGGGLFASFAYQGPFSKWGSWAHWEFFTDSQLDSPKLDAFRRMVEHSALRNNEIAALPQCGNGVIEVGEECDGAVFPHPFTGAQCDKYSRRYREGTLQCSSDCRIDARGCATQTSCVLEMASIDNGTHHFYGDVGDRVKVFVQGRNCRGRTVDVVLREENNTLPDVTLATARLRFDEDQFAAAWITLPNATDAEAGQSQPWGFNTTGPELRAVATLVGLPGASTEVNFQLFNLCPSTAPLTFPPSSGARCGAP